MRKIIKIIGIGLATIVLFGLIFIAYLQFSDIPYYDIKKVDYHAESSPEAIARGQKLASMLCAGCHLDKESGKLIGRKLTDAPAEFGELFSQNITQDKQFGIGNWTDGELLTLLRTGIKKDGQYAPPYMAKLPLMSDEDINAIIAFLRSDNKMVNADPKPDTPCEPSVLTKLLCKVEWKPFSMPTQKIMTPDSTNTVAVGKYLAQNLDCFSCHSADFTTNDFLKPELSVGYFGGGNKPLDMEGRVMLTSNLTPDKETGIGNWSKAKFINALKNGIVEGEHALQYPMEPYIQLTDFEAGAIYDYLQTITPIKNKVIRSDYSQE